MICRQCEPWKPTGDMSEDAALQHLVEVHPGRAITLLKKISCGITNSEPNMFFRLRDVHDHVHEALGHRSEFNTPYGTYE